ncbi:MAG: Fic family protein [Planctomycetes bacterium]|nr:Fic family protein [Planctomycetota bacterium]
MDSKRFTSGFPGRLVPIELPLKGKDWAFIPRDLPPKWDFPPEFWPLLASAKEALGTLNGIGQTLPDPHLLLRPLQTREAISSSSIEGTYVTPEQLLLYELDPGEPKSASDQVADWNEVFNYGRALLHGLELLKTLPICKRLIRELHGVLMAGVRGRDSSRGEFRQCQVQIGSNGRFVPPPPGEVEQLLGNLEKYVNQEDGRFDPLVRCYLIHYQFEAIHPFKDGNGRVGRVLLALMTSKWLGHSMPWLYMSAYYELFREEYVQYLFDISSRGAWGNWIEFCLRGTIAQANDSIRRCHQFNAMRAEFHSRVDGPSSRTHALIEGLFRTPVVTIPSVCKRFDIAYHTAQVDVERLVSANILQESPGVYPRAFFAKEIMHIAYGPTDSSSGNAS